MFIILCGLDRCGKSTISKMIQNRLYSQSLRPVLCTHYSNIKSTKYSVREVSEAHYHGGFELIKQSINDRHVIFDRFHLGEYVYSPLYRGYDGSYVFDLEKQYKDFLSTTYLITLTDSYENLIKRDDGLSHSTNKADMDNERNRFIEAHNKSIIKNKLHVDLEGLTEKLVQQKVLDFIFDPVIVDFSDIDEQDEDDLES